MFTDGSLCLIIKSTFLNRKSRFLNRNQDSGMLKTDPARVLRPAVQVRGDEDVALALPIWHHVIRELSMHK